MFGPCHGIATHQEIIPKCKGCKRIYRRYDGKIVCATHCHPETKWWFGEICPQATFIKRIPDEDPIKEP